MKVAILGTGAYGLALASMFNKNNVEIMIWTKLESEYLELKNNKSNEKVLPNFKIPDNVKITMSIKECVQDSSLIVIAVPAKYVDDISKELRGLVKDKHVCIASKGIEQDTYLFPVDVFKKYNKTSKIAVISGPSFAKDIIENAPIGLSLASKNKKTISVLKEELNTLLNTLQDIINDNL